MNSSKSFDQAQNWTPVVMNPNTPFRYTVIALSLAMTSAAYAEQSPDAGRILQEQQAPRLEVPKPSRGIDISPPLAAKTLPGGGTILIQKVLLSGNKVFKAEYIRQTVFGGSKEVVGKEYDLAGLKDLADQITEFYRSNGYPFARAYVPEQKLTDGTLTIKVVEGRYGNVTALGDARTAAFAQPFLAALKPGEVIKSSSLERATLVLDDQPGIKAAPIIRPGQELGTGDLDVKVSRVRAVSGDVGFDNHGSRASGDQRIRLNALANSPFGFGDQLTFRSLISQHSTWLGSLGYGLPIGASGLRANVAYAHTGYYIGEAGFKGNWGTAEVISAGATYPLLRSQKANATLGLSVQTKNLYNKRPLDSQDYASQSTPMSVQFDVRDSFLGGGITFGSLSWTPGRLHLDAETRESNTEAVKKSNGDFAKYNLDLARLQALPAGFTAYGRVSAQTANKNLDSSEGFGVGGPNGVRAYPTTEGYGNEGWLAQLEVRYAMGAYSPYVFHDAGGVKINTNPWNSDVNSRTLAGSGLGLRIQDGKVSIDASVAWRAQGGNSQSDNLQLDPRGWITAAMRF